MKTSVDKQECFDDFIKEESTNLQRYFNRFVKDYQVSQKTSRVQWVAHGSEVEAFDQYVQRQMARELAEQLLANGLLQYERDEVSNQDLIIHKMSLSVCPSKSMVESVIKEAIEDAYAVFEEL